MINKINANVQLTGLSKNQALEVPAKKSNIAVSRPTFSANYSNAALVNAYQALNNIQTAKTVSFGKSLQQMFKELQNTMFTCNDETQVVGTRYPAQELIDENAEELPKINDAIKTDIRISTDEEKGIKTVARTQLKKTKDGILYEMALRQPQKIEDNNADTHKELSQLIRITADPNIDQNTSVLNTKGKLMAVIEDGSHVLLTNSGEITKKTSREERLHVEAKQKGNVFKPFTPEPQPVAHRTRQASIGEGTEVVIGMETQRFVPEIIKSMEDFIKKIDDGEIVLEQFKANPNAKNIQLSMLAGGFGSRAEYTNASSAGIFHGVRNGAQSTKGVFRTATGLTPMETTFITLHKAGLLDCNNLEIGKNVKFYLNRSGVNKGNGGFTVDLYNKMEREGRNSLAIFPNDSMSRLTKATIKMMDLMNSGNAAVVMIAKEVKSENAKGNFGIMKLGKNNEILEFAEKPKEIPAGYETKKGKCLTNTFQFAVSKEAFKALSIVEPYLPPLEYGAESRDWSKVFTPVIMAITQNDNLGEMQKAIKNAMLSVKDFKGKEISDIPLEVLSEAKSVLGNKKVYAVPTDEPWADCGTLNQLYHTTMQIASNDFKLEDFERKHLLDSINTQTGLVASTPQMKSWIEKNYDINGEVMAVPMAQYVGQQKVEDYISRGLIDINLPTE